MRPKPALSRARHTDHSLMTRHPCSVRRPVVSFFTRKVDPQLAHDATPVPALRQAGLPALRVLVTRPERDARQWVEQLQHSGFEAEALPLIEIAPACGAANRQALRQAWDALADYAACLFVSGHAVEHFFKANPALAQAQVAQELAQASVSAQASAALETLPNHAASSKASSKRDDCLDLPPGLRLMAPGPGGRSRQSSRFELAFELAAWLGRVSSAADAWADTDA
jgi:hypothetical protein